MRKTVLCFLFFFLTIYSYYIAKPIRSSLFLEWMGPRQLPFVYLLSAAVTLLSAALLDWALKHIPPIRLVPGVFALFALTLALFRTAFVAHPKLGGAIAFALYLFIALFAVVAVSLFWATCNDIHTAEEGKRRYNVIGLGGILGGLAGGETTKALVGTVGTENLLLVSAGILALALPIPWLLIADRHRAKGTRPVPLGRTAANSEERIAGIRGIWRDPYVLSIAGLVFLSTFAGSLLDFQYQGIIKEAGMAKDARTAFFGRVFTLVNVVGAGIHLLLTRLVLRRTGAWGGLLPLPIVAIGGAVALLLRPSLGTVAFVWVIYGGLAYSLTQVTRETLYLPIPRRIKYRSKFYIDTFVFRFGDAAVSLLLMASAGLVALGTYLYAGYTIAASLAWVSLVVHFCARLYGRWTEAAVVPTPTKGELPHA